MIRFIVALAAFFLVAPVVHTQAPPQVSGQVPGQVQGQAPVEFGASEQAPSDPMAQPQAEAVRIIELTDENITLDNLLKLRDPFQQPELRQAVKLNQTPLQKFETQDFEVSAIVTGPDQIKAILIDPDGKSHFVRKGEKIGKREGFIEKITATKLVVSEKEVDYFGKVKKIKTELILSEQDTLINTAPELGYAPSGSGQRRGSIEGYSSRVPANPDEIMQDEDNYDSSELKKSLGIGREAAPTPQPAPAQPSPPAAAPQNTNPIPNPALPVPGREGPKTYIPQYSP